MKLPCPACHAVFSLDAAIEDAAARAAFARAAAIPGNVGQHLVGYLALFRPSRNGLTWKRVGKLLDELLPMIETETAERDGRRQTVPIASWIEAMQELAGRRGEPGFRLPLKSHGYLIEVAMGIAGKVEAKAERQVEESRRQGLHRPKPVEFERTMIDVIKDHTEGRLNHAAALAELRGMNVNEERATALLEPKS